MPSDSPSLARSLATKLLFVVGVLVLLGLLAWAILKFVPKVVSGIAGVGGAVSGLFGGSALDVAVSPDTVRSGEPANVSWVYDDADGSGVYSLSYNCKSDATLTLERDGSAKKTMACGTGYSLGQDAGFATVTPKLSAGSSLTDVDLRVAYRQDSKDVAEGSQLLTVTDGSGYGSPDPGESAASEGTVTSEPSGGAVQSGSGYTVNWGTGGSGATYTGGLPNLSVGGATIDSDGNLTFDVRNTGGRATGVWDFIYTTPTSPSDTFNGPAMISLNPGEGLRVRIRFAEVDSGSHSVEVRIDPYGHIAETVEADNVLLMTVRRSGSSSGGGSSSGNDDANLRLYGLEVGRIDSDDDFDEDDTISDNEDAAVKFKVQNDGDEDTGSWRYEVDLPGSGDDYRSSSQGSLDPGETKTITVNLGELDADDYDIEVTVDSDDDVDEEDEDDNEDSADLEVN